MRTITRWAACRSRAAEKPARNGHSRRPRAVRASWSMTEVLTAGAILLAWFVFRYDRHGRQRDAIEAADGTLRAVHYGMVQGLTPGQPGWGQGYFSHDYTESAALERAGETHTTVMQRGMDQIFVVPTEPLARLATSSPQEGLIDAKTVAVAHFALWKVHVFNQLVRQLTDFNAMHGAEIQSQATDPARREELLQRPCLSLTVCTNMASGGRGRSSRLAGGGAGTAHWSRRLAETCATCRLLATRIAGDGCGCASGLTPESTCSCSAQWLPCWCQPSAEACAQGRPSSSAIRPCEGAHEVCRSSPPMPPDSPLRGGRWRPWPPAPVPSTFRASPQPRLR